MYIDKLYNWLNENFFCGLDLEFFLRQLSCQFVDIDLLLQLNGKIKIFGLGMLMFIYFLEFVLYDNL